MSEGTDGRWMKRALTLAARGKGATHPNPLVGAVLVKGGRSVGEGWHRAPGGPHAEVEALRRAGTAARGSTLYVTLEPCDHQGRTPPCTGALLAAGVARVVAAVRDPNPLVDGKGLARLRRAGVEVACGLMEKEARELNFAYLHWRATGMPFVTLKLALSLDGRIAAPSRRSRWITGEESRREVHRMRSEADAVMVGVGTVVSDDPRLTARGAGKGRQPLRLVLDPRLRTPLGSSLVQAASDGRTFLAVERSRAGKKGKPYLEKGVRILPLPAPGGRFRWADLGKVLAQMGVLHLLAEGGAETAAWLLRQGAVSRLEFFYGPLLVGGEGVPALGDLRMRDLPAAFRVRTMRVRRRGEDLQVSAELKGP